MPSSVETFRQTLESPDWPPRVAVLEQYLVQGLTGCERLIRWAIVATAERTVTIEGCYLKTTRD